MPFGEDFCGAVGVRKRTGWPVWGSQTMREWSWEAVTTVSCREGGGIEESMGGGVLGDGC